MGHAKRGSESVPIFDVIPRTRSTIQDNLQQGKVSDASSVDRGKSLLYQQRHFLQDINQARRVMALDLINRFGKGECKLLSYLLHLRRQVF